MRLPITRHEDDRRILTEWNRDIPMSRCKIIESKGKAILGRHYHERNDSIFYMFKGKGNYILKSAYRTQERANRGWLFEGDAIFVPRGVVHTFQLFPGAVMMEACSESYDAKDEIVVQ